MDLVSSVSVSSQPKRTDPSTDTSETQRSFCLQLAGFCCRLWSFDASWAQRPPRLCAHSEDTESQVIERFSSRIPRDTKFYRGNI
ncbi:hypothetical protein F2P81_006625 [Scophthalmus maximus]|uniref:Uncharacterized protein n=1 Tax=Scophthalmus maximus TaxID=52904 RepID=A0A6A4T3K2_SCOMX|nr:hypothetical protein F2P81_006625 [Scophthalmus maximus]